MSEKAVISKTAQMCPIVFTFIEAWSKSLSTENFERLIAPRASKIQNSFDAKLQEPRVFLILDWLVRKSAPNWLEQAGMDEPARKLRELPELPDTSVSPLLEFVGITPLERANRLLFEIAFLFEQHQWSTSIKQNAQQLAQSIGVVAALSAVVKFQRPALSLVAFRAANISFNGAAALLSTGTSPKEDGTIKPAGDLLDKLLDFDGWITINGPR